MSSIFVSYSSTDRNQVKAAADDLHDLGHTVWFDRELTGGHEWWDDILQSIRACDVFIFGLSPRALDSHPCNLEYKYAYALGKPILPILLSDVNINLLPGELSKIHFVDYRQPENRQSVKALAKAMNSLPEPLLLPDPLPTPPEAPISTLGKLRNRIDAPELPFQEQTALVFELKTLLNNGESAGDARVLLNRLLQHADLRSNIEREINMILATSQLPAETAPQKLEPKRGHSLQLPRTEPESAQQAQTSPTPTGKFLDLRNSGVLLIRFVLIVAGVLVSGILLQSLRGFSFPGSDSAYQIQPDNPILSWLAWCVGLSLSILSAVELPQRLKISSTGVRVSVIYLFTAVYFIAGALVPRTLASFYLAHIVLTTALVVEALIFGTGFILGSMLSLALWQRFALGFAGMLAGCWLYTIVGGYLFDGNEVLSQIIFTFVLAFCAFLPEIVQSVIRVARNRNA